MSTRRTRIGKTREDAESVLRRAGGIGDEDGVLQATLLASGASTSTRANA